MCERFTGGWGELCQCRRRREDGFTTPFATVLSTKNPAVNWEILSKLPALESACRQSQRGETFLFTPTPIADLCSVKHRNQLTHFLFDLLILARQSFLRESEISISQVRHTFFLGKPCSSNSVISSTRKVIT